LKRKQTNPHQCKDIKNLADKLPEELRTIYDRARKGSEVVERLKVAAALKLWGDRGYREVGFGVPCDFGGRTAYVDVLARDADDVVGVECVSRLHLGWLRWRIAQLRRCLPPDGYLVIIFPSNVDDKQVDKVVGLVDEVWVTGKDKTEVERMMFTSVIHRG
jgi:hypothetical protein